MPAMGLLMIKMVNMTTMDLLHITIKMENLIMMDLLPLTIKMIVLIMMDTEVQVILLMKVEENMKQNETKTQLNY